MWKAITKKILMILTILKDTFAVQIIRPKLPNDLSNYLFSLFYLLLPTLAGEFYFAVVNLFLPR